ncbi:MAG: AI-2E family transporter [Treponema sp.]|jgi:predicted PurR-regulated permease PerM|nr:AI-2E family transporter [Treponema sp.]
MSDSSSKPNREDRRRGTAYPSAGPSSGDVPEGQSAKRESGQAETQEKGGGFNFPPVQTLVFTAILIILFILVCRLFAPFFSVLLWSVLLYVLASPFHHRVIRNLDFSKISGRILKNFWAVLFALGTAVVILFPLSFVASAFSRQILELTRYVRDVFSSRPEAMQDFFRNISAFINDVSNGQITITGREIETRLLELLNSSLLRLFSVSSRIARDVGSFLIGIVMLIFTLFFLYADGPYLSRLVLGSIPIRREYLKTITGKFMDITRSLFFGYIMVALIQSVMAYIVFVIFSVKGALVLAMITFICVFIPMIGGGLVWLPLGLIRVISGDPAGGILFLIVSGFFISLLDNVLRPMFLKDRIQLHPLIIFFAILGGVSVYGFNGLILGPMVVILFLTVLDLFLSEHKIEHKMGEDV